MTHQSDAAGSGASAHLLSSPSRPAQIGRITSTQARMARAALRRSLADVAMATGGALVTISRIENDGVVSRKTRASSVATTKSGESSLPLMRTTTQ